MIGISIVMNQRCRGVGFGQYRYDTGYKTLVGARTKRWIIEAWFKNFMRLTNLCKLGFCLKTLD